MGNSRFGTEKPIWKPTAVRDVGLEQSNHVRIDRTSPGKSFDLTNMSMTGQSRMHRARSTAALQPYEESIMSMSQVASRRDQERLVDRLHSDAKFKNEMRVIYD